MEFGLDVDGRVGLCVGRHVSFEETVDSESPLIPAPREGGRREDHAGQEVLGSDFLLAAEDAGRHAGFGEHPAEVVVIDGLVFLGQPGEVGLEVLVADVEFDDLSAAASILPDGAEDIARLDFAIGNDDVADGFEDAAGTL
jgi:hypothetical protein